MTISLGGALAITLLVLVIFFIVALVGLCISWWSSLAISLLISLIVLWLLYPPGYVLDTTANWLLAIYGLFQLIALIYLIIYIILMAITDRKRTIRVQACDGVDQVPWWLWFQ